MATYEVTTRIEPIFSIDVFPEEALTKDVLQFRNAINASLQKEKISVAEAVVCLPLPNQLRVLSGERTMLLEKAYEIVRGHGLTPAQIPHLLGLYKEAKEFLLSRMEDALRIETFCFPNQYIFADTLGRDSQLCLRRARGSLLIDVSEYVKKGVINYAKRYSGNTVRGLFYLPHETASGKKESEDLSRKMIG